MSRIRQVSSVARIACAVAITAPLVAGCSGASDSATPAPSTKSGSPSGGVAGSTPTPEPARTPCPNPEGQACLGNLAAGTYKTRVFHPAITYTVPAGWKNYEDTPGNFLLVPPHGDLPGVNAGTSDTIRLTGRAVSAASSTYVPGRPTPAVPATARGRAPVASMRSNRHAQTTARISRA